MSAVTPKAPNHANLPPLASRFVDVAALPWEKTPYPGCESKTLMIDRASGALTMLLRMAPAGSRHEAWAGPEGGLMMTMFQIPNRFYQPDGREVDFLGNDWERTWGEVYARQEQAKFA
jgi:hypothetical protein